MTDDNEFNTPPIEGDPSEWTEMSRYRSDDGVVHATFAKTFGDNTKFKVCRALRETKSYPFPEETKDNPITCLQCLGHLGG